ncbi:MAG TPA: methyl-accepting chemotaxis protein, partial [Kofleriaceae bacterium]|nr:methyl-accepting chemotaxis protein [Kofleriaceae bacterium]
IGAPVALIILISSANALLAVSDGRSLQRDTATVLGVDARMAADSVVVQSKAFELRRFEKDLFLNVGDKKAEASYVDKWQKTARELQAVLASIEAGTDERGAQITAGMRKNLEKYEVGFAGVRDQIAAGTITTPQAGNQAISPVKDAIRSIETSAQELREYKDSRLTAARTRMSEAAQHSEHRQLLLLCVAIAIGSTVGYFLARSLMRPLSRLLGVAESVSTAASQLAASVTNITDGTRQQAGAVQTTASALEEVTASISMNSEHARSTEDMASRSSRSASDGGQAVRATVQQMRDIAGKVTVIEDIAYMTNLLALNAAIEAGRAGEHGRGFAVVAAEVRKLAERSQTAAAEINDLVGRSVQVADATGSQLQTLVGEAEKVSTLVSEVAAACREQRTAVGTINDAMVRIDGVMRTNLRETADLAQTADELGKQAQVLSTLVDTLRGRGHKPAAAVTAPAPVKATVAATPTGPIGIVPAANSNAKSTGRAA